MEQAVAQEDNEVKMLGSVRFLIVLLENSVPELYLVAVLVIEV